MYEELCLHTCGRHCACRHKILSGLEAVTLIDVCFSPRNCGHGLEGIKQGGTEGRKGSWNSLLYATAVNHYFSCCHSQSCSQGITCCQCGLYDGLTLLPAHNFWWQSICNFCLVVWRSLTYDSDPVASGAVRKSFDGPSWRFTLVCEKLHSSVCCGATLSYGKETIPNLWTYWSVMCYRAWVALTLLVP